MNWITIAGGYHLEVPIKHYYPGATYDIHIVKRPWYCDRGDWLILVDGINDIDYNDGFPRYYFGTDDEVKQQMEIWLNRRKAFREYKPEHIEK
jgi:hypothetical protein